MSAGTQMCKKTRCQGGNKVKKLFAVLLTVCLMLGMFSACSNGKDTVDDPANTGAENGLSVSKEPIKDLVTYVVASQEMSTFNILYSQSTNETQVLTNCIDGLLSHDNYGNLVPALAESWESDDGGLTWTFHLRKGVQWVDYQAQPQTDVVADDWLWGLEWVLNFYKNGTYNTSMPKKMIAGAEDYYNYTAGYEDLAADADDDAKKAYEEDKAAFEALCAKYDLPTTRLTEEEGKNLDLTIFKKMVGIEAPDDYTLVYHCTSPMAYFPTLATYNCLYPASHDLIEKLGVDGFLACTYDNMWYNGCYTITTYVNANEKVLTKNPLYWDTDCTLFDSVTYKMVESKDVAFQMFQAGEVDDITLTESNLHTIYDNPSNEYHDNLVESRPTKFSYQIHFCWDKYLENGEPDTNWNTAIANESFRKAWYYGLDLTPYLARTNYINPQNCANYAYTMSNLVSFSDGTEYTQRVMDKLGIKADGTSFARYDAAKADEYKSKAIEELTAKGVTFPVEIDYYIKASDQTALDNANVMKQMFSDCLGDDFVTFNIKTYVSSVAKEVRNPQLASFYVNAWGADYGDPQNFLGQETYGDDNAWYSTAYSKANNITDPELLAVYQKFTAMVEKASNTTDDMDARYEAYADAEAYMLDKVITLPLYKVVSWEMTHVNDYSKIYAPYGIQINKFKNWETSVDLYTTEDYAKLAAIYEANAAK